MRTIQINLSLERTISRQRLDKYLASGGDDIHVALGLYEANMCLSEAFYTPLQCLEVCLRNCLHEQLSNAYGANWLLNGKPNLDKDSREMVQDAIKETCVPDPSAGAIVAELKFAFWVGLLAQRYDNTLWRQALHKAFRVGTGQRRSVVHGRMNAIRRFRNRVMHHEPIFQRAHQQMHAEILEAIGWMCRDTKAWVTHHSRYPAVAATFSAVLV